MPGSNGVCDGMMKPLLTSTHAGDIASGRQNRQMNPHRGTMPWLAIHLDPALMINPSCDLQAVDTIGQDKEEEFQLKARGRDRMNRFGQHSLQ